MAILRVQTIGTPFFGGSTDFPNPQAWFDANCGDLVSSGLICIGLLKGELTPSYYQGWSSGIPTLIMDASKCTTDASHYYILRGGVSPITLRDSNAKFAYGSGTFPSGWVDQDIVKNILSPFGATWASTTDSRHYDCASYDSPCTISGNVPFTRLENLVVHARTTNIYNINFIGETPFKSEQGNTTPYLPQCKDMAAIILTSGIVDSCRICTINTQYNVPQTTTISAIGIQPGSNTIVRNCLVEDVFAKVASISGTVFSNGRIATAIGIGDPGVYLNQSYREIYNNTVKHHGAVVTGDLTILNGAVSYGIYINGFNDSVINNISLSGNAAHYANIGTSKAFDLAGSAGQIRAYNFAEDNSNAGTLGCVYNIPASSLFLSSMSALPSGRFSQDGWWTLDNYGSGDNYDSRHINPNFPYISSGLNLYNNVSGWVGRQFLWDIEGQPRVGNWTPGADQVGYGLNVNAPEDFTLTLNAIPAVSGTPTDAITLYIESKIPTIGSGNTNLVIQNNLSTSSGIYQYIGGLSGINDSSTLYTAGPLQLNSNLVPLFIQLGSGAPPPQDMNLFIAANPHTYSSGNVTLHTSSTSGSRTGSVPLSTNVVTAYSGNDRNFNLFIKSDGSAVIPNSMNLFLKTYEVNTLNNLGDSNTIFPLYTKAISGQATQSVPILLYNVANTNSGSGGYFNLFTRSEGPVPVSGGNTLYVESKPPVSGFGTWQLFIKAEPVPTGTVPLHLNSSSGSLNVLTKLYIVSIANNSGNFNLFIQGPSRDTPYSTIPLYIDASHVLSGIPLIMSGSNRLLQNNLNLTVGGAGLISKTKSAPLYMWSTTIQGTRGYQPLFIESARDHANINLFVGSPSSVYTLDNLNLFIGSYLPQAKSNVDLTLHTTDIRTKPLRLHTIGASPLGIDDGSSDGFTPKFANMNLFMNRQGGDSSMVNLSMLGGAWTTYSGLIPLKLAGVSGIPTSGTTFMIKGNIPTSQFSTLYTHGFHSRYITE